VDRQKTLPLKLVTIACITALIVLGTNPNFLTAVNISPSFAQNAQPQELWQEVYKKLPNLPLENKYVSKDTRKVDTNSTLVTRLLQYHLYVKGRAPGYRLDWKLTLADYLGVNELIEEAAYPGNATLNSNPLEGDRAVINRLTRTERNNLVQTLVSLFRQNSRATNSPSSGVNSPSNPNQSNSPAPPRPGDAQRLKL
jgi:hypothetical protein